MNKPHSRYTIDDSLLLTDLARLAQAEVEKEEENFYFKEFLLKQNGEHVDILVQKLNDEITPAIDCTACGNCCKSLMINVTLQEAKNLSTYLNMDVDALKEKYIETSLQGDMVINTIPCHFLQENRCNIYEHRFTECREFPGLHRANFNARLFSTFMHYGRCPIVYNVVEQLKVETGFKVPADGKV